MALFVLIVSHTARSVHNDSPNDQGLHQQSLDQAFRVIVKTILKDKHIIKPNSGCNHL